MSQPSLSLALSLRFKNSESVQDLSKRFASLWIAKMWAVYPASKQKISSVPNDASSWADVTMANKDVVAYYIDLFKRANCELLMDLLNNYWTKAAFQQSGLDRKKVVHLIKKVKKNALTIQRLCRSNPNYIPWDEVRTKKRKSAQRYEPREKRRKNWKYYTSAPVDNCKFPLCV